MKYFYMSGLTCIKETRMAAALTYFKSDRFKALWASADIGSTFFIFIYSSIDVTASEKHTNKIFCRRIIVHNKPYRITTYSKIIQLFSINTIRILLYLVSLLV